MLSYFSKSNPEIEKDYSIPSFILRLNQTDYIHNGEHGFDLEKVNYYLDQFTNLHDKAFAMTVIKYTKYVTFDELVKNARSCFKKFLNDTSCKFYIGLTCSKLGSEYILLSRMIDLIPSTRFLGIVNETNYEIFKNEMVNIVMIDDCMFSGNHITNFIDTLTFDAQQTLDISQNELLKKVNYHLVVPYQSKVNSIDYFKGIRTVVKYYHEIIKPISELYRLDDLNETLQKFDCECDCYPFYTDIKVSNNFGSFPSIYLEGLVPNKSKIGSILKKNPSKYIV